MTHSLVMMWSGVSRNPGSAGGSTKSLAAGRKHAANTTMVANVHQIWLIATATTCPVPGLMETIKPRRLEYGGTT